MGVNVKPRSWLQSLLKLDRRRAERWASPRLSVYFCNGWSSRESAVRDISASGIYLKTDAEWFPGVKLMLTLQRKEIPKANPARWIAVEAEVVRKGSDGMGLLFIPSGYFGPDEYGSEIPFGANRKNLARFLSVLFKDDMAHLRQQRQEFLSDHKSHELH